MPHNIIGSNAFTDPVPAYADGDPVAQASNDSTIQALANRDVNLTTRLGVIEGQNLNSRITTIEGQNLNSRLTTVEGYRAICFGHIQTDGAGGFTVSNLKNCTASLTGSAGHQYLHIAGFGTLANANYTVLTTGPANGGQSWQTFPANAATSSFDIQTVDKTDAIVGYDTNANLRINFAVFEV